MGQGDLGEGEESGHGDPRQRRVGQERSVKGQIRGQVKDRREKK